MTLSNKQQKVRSPAANRRLLSVAGQCFVGQGRNNLKGSASLKVRWVNAAKAASLQPLAVII